VVPPKDWELRNHPPAGGGRRCWLWFRLRTGNYGTTPRLQLSLLRRG